MVRGTPSGTEDVYKLYAESFRDAHHLQRIQEEAQAILSVGRSGLDVKAPSPSAAPKADLSRGVDLMETLCRPKSGPGPSMRKSRSRTRSWS